MKTNRTHLLYWISLLYLFIPVVVFVLGWFSWLIALPLAALIAYILISAFPRNQDVNDTNPLALITIVFSGFTSLAWVTTSGVWNFGSGRTQDWDVMRNDMLSTLTKHSWPVTNSFPDSSSLWTMRHYLAFYLPGSLIGKATGGNLSITLFATGVWMVFGVWIAFLLLLELFSRFGNRKYIVLFLFVGFSGLDAIGSRIQGTLSLRPSSLINGGHIEWWAERFQFSSNTTLLHWVPQHAIPSWIGALLVIHIVRSRQNLSLIPIVSVAIVLWSPFAALGVTLLALILLVNVGLFAEFVRSIRESRFRTLAILLTAIPLILFLQSGTSEIPHSFLFSSGSFSHNVALLAKFIPLEFGLVAILTGLVVRRTTKEQVVISVALSMVLMVVIGLYNDFAMRVSPALLVVIMVNAGEALISPSKSMKNHALRISLGCILAIGSITPLFEIISRHQTPYNGLQSPCLEGTCESDLTSLGLRSYNWTAAPVGVLRNP
jgi:hypothetical protein